MPMLLRFLRFLLRVLINVTCYYNLMESYKEGIESDATLKLGVRQSLQYRLDICCIETILAREQE